MKFNYIVVVLYLKFVLTEGSGSNKCMKIMSSSCQGFSMDSYSCRNSDSTCPVKLKPCRLKDCFIDFNPLFVEKQIIKRHLDQNTKTIMLENFEKATLMCKNEVKQGKIEWMRDGQINKIHTLNGRKLVIQSDEDEPNGIYICFSRISTRQRQILGVWPVVLASSEKRLKSGQSGRFECRGSLIKSIFSSPEMFSVWYKDGKVVENRSLEWRNWLEFEATSIDFLTLTKVNQTFSGFYKCVVFDSSSGRNWTLNQFKLIVKDSGLINIWLFDENVGMAIRLGAGLAGLMVTFNIIYHLLRNCHRRLFKKSVFS